jgi:hypothetical protein
MDMDEFLQQLPALLGVLIGSGATYVATAAAERSRWKRAQSVRWDERRLSAYMEHADALKRVLSTTVRMAAHEGLTTARHPLPPDEGMAMLDEAEDDRTAKWEAVLTLGNDEVIVACRKWRECARKLQLVVLGELPRDAWPEVAREAAKARADYYAALKRDMGLSLPASLETYEWRMGSHPDSP